MTRRICARKGYDYMNTIDAAAASPIANNSRTPVLIRKIGNKTFEVSVHFSETSKETLTDKIMRLVQNDIQSTDLT